MGLRRRAPRPELVVIERSGDSSAKWLFWGAIIGAGVALLYAPRNGEETRRSLQRNLWRVRAATEEKLDELMEHYGPGRGSGYGTDELDDDEYERLAAAEAQAAGDPMSAAADDELEPGLSAREELERRLADARARRRARDLEEPQA